MSAVDELKSIKSRYAPVTTEDMLKASQRIHIRTRGDQEKMLDQQDEALIQSIFGGTNLKHHVIDYDDDDDDCENEIKLPIDCKKPMLQPGAPSFVVKNKAAIKPGDREPVKNQDFNNNGDSNSNALL